MGQYGSENNIIPSHLLVVAAKWIQGRNETQFL